MKKSAFNLFSIVLCSTLFFDSFAQVDKGTKFIGGNLSIMQNSMKSTNTFTESAYSNSYVSLSPRVGLYLCNSIAMGFSLSLGFNRNTQEYIDSKSTNSNYSYGLSGFCRYNKPVNEKLGVFFEGGASLIFSNGKSSVENYPPFYSKTEYKTTGTDFTVGIIPGIIYFICPKLGIEASYGRLGYSYFHQKNYNSTSTSHSNNSTFALNLNPSSLAIGLHYYFGNKEVVN